MIQIGSKKGEGRHLVTLYFTLLGQLTAGGVRIKRASEEIYYHQRCNRLRVLACRRLFFHFSWFIAAVLKVWNLNNSWFLYLKNSLILFLYYEPHVQSIVHFKSGCMISSLTYFLYNLKSYPFLYSPRHICRDTPNDCLNKYLQVTMSALDLKCFITLQ